MSTVIEVNGVKVKQTAGGLWKCPFRCGDSRFPARKWKTEAGLRKHLAECPSSPSAIAARNARKEIERQHAERQKQEALAICPYVVGQRIFYVHEIIVRPTHEERYGRMVKVRYEAEKRFEAREAEIKTIDFNQALLFNGYIWVSSVCASMQEAKEHAAARQKGYDEHCAFAASVR